MTKDTALALKRAKSIVNCPSPTCGAYGQEESSARMTYKAVVKLPVRLIKLMRYDRIEACIAPAHWLREYYG